MENAFREVWNSKPKEVNGQFNLRVMYYTNELFNLVKGIFDIKVNAKWDLDYFKSTLLSAGVIGVLDSDYGIIALEPSTYGQNLYLRPCGARYVNPYISADRTIGVDTELIYLYNNNTFGGIMPTISIYANMLASVDCSISCNLINTRVATVFEVEDSQQLATAEKMYDDVSGGKPVAFLRKDRAIDGKDGGIKFYQIDCKKTYIADVLQTEKRNIINEFLTKWGINNANTEKRERLLVDEINANNAELEFNVALIKENLKMCQDKVNAMFPNLDFSISVKQFAERTLRRGEYSETQRYADVVRGNTQQGESV